MLFRFSRNALSLAMGEGIESVAVARVEILRIGIVRDNNSSFGEGGDEACVAIAWRTFCAF